jgi:hypothetical protein
LTFPDPWLYFFSMVKQASLRLALAVLAVFAFGIPMGGQGPASSGDFPMRTFFSVRSARPDATVPAVFREQFEKDDGSPLRSVPIDLDGDGREERFVLCGVPSASGGYQWLVYDPARAVGRGIVIGAIIFVSRESDGGYPRLETYWKQGGDMSIVFRYTYARGKYGRSGTRALTLWETSEYFRSKPPLDLERELAEIK